MSSNLSPYDGIHQWEGGFVTNHGMSKHENHFATTLENPLILIACECHMPPLQVYIMIVLDHNPITSPVNERYAWNPIRHIWIVLAKIVGSFFETTLEVRPHESCDINLGFHKELVPLGL